jgi:DNA-binding CsgD family transcriptional regulator
MASRGPGRLKSDVLRLVHEDRDVPDFARAVSGAVARSIPFDGVSLLTMDPATGLPTGAFVENGLPGESAMRIAEIEYRETDFNKFDRLARSGRLAASLARATGGDLDRSLRHRELRARDGWGDELRTALVSDGAMWGSLTLHRTADREPFGVAEVALMAGLSGHLAEGLRRALLVTSSTGDGDEENRPSGLALLAADNSIVRADSAAERWLSEMRITQRDEPLAPTVIAVASRARNLGADPDPSGMLAQARIRTPSGTWLTVRASVLGGDDGLTAVTLEPTRLHELAPLIADAYELTERERVVTQLVAQGLSTDAIAARLYLSPWTVQDHLKSIFEKVGVSSRGELVARIYFDHYAPRLN